MAIGGQVNFYIDKVLVEVRQAKLETIAAAAHRIEERAKANVVANDQVDTGAMLNGIYVVLADGGDYGQAKAAAEAREPQGEMAPPVSLRNADGAVVAGMEYSIYQEMQRSFLYKAAEETAREMEGLVRKV
jgi:hypothetical protein